MTSQPSPVEAEKASGPLQVRRGSDCKARRENFFPLLLSNRSIEKCISLEFGHVGSRLATQGRQRLIESALSVAGSEREWIAGDTLLLLRGASFFVFFSPSAQSFLAAGCRWPQRPFMCSFAFETPAQVFAGKCGSKQENSLPSVCLPVTNTRPAFTPRAARHCLLTCAAGGNAAWRVRFTRAVN